MLEPGTFQQAISAAGIGVWQYQPHPLGRFTCNDTCAKIIGLDNPECQFEELEQHINTDDLYLLNNNFNNNINSGAFTLTVKLKQTSKSRWIKITCTGLNADKSIYGIATEVTQEVKAKQEAAYALSLANVAVKGTNVGIFVFNFKTGDLKHSPAFTSIITGLENDIPDRDKLSKHIHPEDVVIRSKAYETALETGDVYYEARVIWQDKSIHKIRVVGTYSFDENNEPLQFSGTVQDITAQYEKELALQQAEEQFRVMVEKAPVAMMVFKGKDIRIENVNPPMLQILGRDHEIVGKTLIEALPEINMQPVFHHLKMVYISGNAYTGHEMPVLLVRNGNTETGYFNFTFTPLIENEAVNGVLVVATEVTRHVTERIQLQESESRFRTIIEEAPIATCLFVGRKHIVEIANERMIRIWGKTRDVIGLPLALAVPELKGQPFIDILDNIYETGEPFVGTAAKAYLEVNGAIDSFYFDFTYHPLKNANGEVYAIVDMAIDVTAQVKARQLIADAEDALRQAIEMAELGTWTYYTDSKHFDFSNRLRSWFGFDENEIVTYEKWIESITTLDRIRIENSLQQSIVADGREYREDFTIVNKLNATERIIQTQGIFYYNEEGAMYKITGTAQDVTKQRKIQLALEQEVQVRTNQLLQLNKELQHANNELNKTNYHLQHSNEELEQYAYVASHDLQEPLRKIRIFSDMLRKKIDTDDSHRVLLHKIIQSSERMTLLIDDLLQFSRLLKPEAQLHLVNLNDIVQDVMDDFELMIREKKAVLTVTGLPILSMVPLQANQLFFNLLSNALKFVPLHTNPVISISATTINSHTAAKHISMPLHGINYQYIRFTDNGIGFEPELADKIFEVFKRLHARDSYPGSGIGLALCRRIVSNHNGHIFATSAPGKGTTFHIILPEKQIA